MKSGVSGLSGHLGRAVVSELPQRPGGQEPQWPCKGLTAAGIYELDGDTLRLCHSWKGQTKRPEKFATSERSRLVLALWNRENKEIVKSDPVGAILCSNPGAWAFSGLRSSASPAKLLSELAQVCILQR